MPTGILLFFKLKYMYVRVKRVHENLLVVMELLLDQKLSTLTLIICQFEMNPKEDRFPIYLHSAYIRCQRRERVRFLSYGSVSVCVCMCKCPVVNGLSTALQW